MNKLHIKLLLAILALSAAQVHAVRYTNKTAVSLRPHGVNMPMESTLFPRLHKAHGANNWNGKLQASVFFQQSENKRDLGRLLLFNKQDSVTLTRGVAAHALSVADVAAGKVDLGYVMHSWESAVADPVTLLNKDAAFSLKLAPVRHSYGLNLGYEYDLCNFVRGLRFNISAPVVSIQHDLNKIVTSANSETQAAVNKYFNGTYQVNEIDGENNQDFLKKAVLADQRAVGVADVNVELNYHAKPRSWCTANLGLGLTIPTGGRPDGSFAFQPIVGNNHHVGIGAQGSMMSDLVSHGEHEVNLNGGVRYRYLLEGAEGRTLGIKGRNFGQYQLLAKAGTAASAANLAGGMLIPAANVLTQAVDVTPGHQVDATAGLAYSWRKVSVDLGYNLFFRNKESLRLRNPFTDNVYAVAKRDYATAGATAATAANPQTNFENNIPLSAAFNALIDDGYENGVVNAANLDLRAATDEGQMTHALFASAGVVMNGESTPVVAGIGASYEFANNNNSLEQWNVWAKAGISF